jgi:large subunit ribosomal protein L15
MAESQDKRVPILSRLSPPEGAVRGKRRIGRGIGSGWGKTAGKGQKGQKARGTMKRLGFQGGQMPLQRRLPKIGFNNHNFQTVYAPVNVGDLEVFAAGTVVDEAGLREQRIVRGPHWNGVKVLADGEIDRALTLKVNAISAAAKEKIEKAGGKVELIEKKQAGPAEARGSARVRKNKATE